MKIRTLVLGALFATSIPAYADGTAKAPATPTKPAPAKAAKLAKPDIAIVAHLHRVNLMEIDMGKLAKLKGTDTVKKYGDMLIKDHTTADKELVMLAKQGGVARIPAARPKDELEKAELAAQHDGMKKLETLKGADFDRAYLQMMVEGHDKELAKSDPFIAATSHAELKTMLEARKSTLQRHSDAAKELQKGTAQATAPDATPKPPVAPKGTSH